MEENKTVEQLLAELETIRGENEKLKQANSNSNSEAAKFKKLLSERETESEKVAREQAEHLANLERLNKEMERRLTVSDHRSELLAAGFSEDLAGKTAEAMADGNTKAFFENLRTFIESHDKEVVEKQMENTPKPGGKGGPAPKVTKEEFDKMSYSERVSLYAENKELYEELTK